MGWSSRGGFVRRGDPEFNTSRWPPPFLAHRDEQRNNQITDFGALSRMISIIKLRFLI